MATFSQFYGALSGHQIFNTNLASLANNAAYQSAVITLPTSSVGPTNLLIGQEVGFKTASGSLGSNPVINVWASASIDGTHFGGSYGANTLGGGLGSFSMPTNTGNLILLRAVPVNAAASAEFMEPVDLQSVWQFMPPYLVIVVQNLTGLALDSSAPGDLWYLPGNYQSA